MKTEYWTTWGSRIAESLCSKHTTREQAERAATRCERDGGSKHRIWKVQRVPRKKVK